MSDRNQERERELAELLSEVRALRETIDQLRTEASPQTGLPPDYQVLVRSQTALPPDYAVAVRTHAFPPEYAVAVREALQPEYAVLVRPQLPFRPPSYEVLVRPAIPQPDEPPTTTEQ